MKRFLFFIVFLLVGLVSAQAQDNPVLISNGRTNICSGTLYDTGGVAGNYREGEVITMTLCPDTPGGSIRLEFTSFLLGPYAALHIYDGTTAGNEIPGSPFTRDNPIANNRLIGVSNPEGCMTLMWTSASGQPTAPGFSAEISCGAKDCQVISPRLLRTIPSFATGVQPACAEDLGVLRACVGEEIKVYGSADFSRSGDGATYTWDFDNGVERDGKNATITYNEKGAYRVRFLVEDGSGNGCVKSLSFIIQVGDNEADIELTSNKPEYCLGETVLLKANASIREVPYVPVLPESNPVALPDGPDPVTNKPRFFYSYLHFKQYCDDDKIETPEDIIQLCVDIEHTWMGDLDVIVIAPNGAQVALLLKDTENGLNNGHYLGNPNNRGGANPIGTPLKYCFQSVAPVVVPTWRGAPTQAGTGTRGGTTKSPGTYRVADVPGNSLNNFIGAPLNGTWTLRVEDKWGSDEGYLFGWQLKFHDRFDLPDLSFTPQIVSQRWLPAQGLVETTNGEATVNHTVPGEYTYTYEVIDNFGCSYTEDITIVVKDKPILGNVPNLLSCIDPVTGKATFNLSDINASIGGNYEITYYETEHDATMGINALTNTHTINAANGVLEKTIWVRVSNNLECFVVDSFKLIAKRCAIDLVPLADLAQCRNADGTVSNFDLTVQTPIVYYGNPNYNVSYFNTNADATNNVNPIPNPANYPFTGVGNRETIFVRVQHNTNLTEFATISFALVVNEKPVIHPLEPLRACALDEKVIGEFNLDVYTPIITGGNNMEVLYYKTAQGAIDNDPALLIQNASAYEAVSGVIGYRVTNLITGCFNVGTINLEVVSLPELNRDVMLMACSSSTTPNGIGEFTLQTAIPMILQNGVDARIDVQFYRTHQNAVNEINPINTARPFVNDVPYNQIIFAKVFFINSQCFEIVEVELVVSPRVLINNRVEAEVCVENVNREIILDLTTYENEILNGLNPAEYEVSYYTTKANADAKIRPIAAPNHHSSTVTRNVWVRVESRATGCYGLSNLIIVPIQAPVIEPLPIYSVCEEESGQGYGSFNLSDYLNTFLNGRTGLEVGFYATATDAANMSNPLNGNLYRNTTAYEQVIFVRFQGENGCPTIKPLTLKAIAVPVLNIPQEPIGICSVSNDGIGTFDLLALVTDLQNGNPSIILNFYQTEENAINDLNRIPNPRAYTNLTPGGDTIYVRGELRGGCFVVEPLELVVISSPILPISLDDLVQCSNDVLVETASFNLTVQTPSIIDAQVDPNNTFANLEVKYFLNKANAEANSNVISNPTNFIGTNQTIWYRVYNKRTGCFAVGNFKLVVNKPLALTAPAAIVLCQPELPNTGRAIFDLTIRELQILGREIDRVTFKYYESEVDAKQDRNAIANPRAYQNTENPKTIWIAVTSFNGCRSFVSMVISVSPLADVNFNPTPLHSCVTNIATNSAIFDLKSKEYEIANQSRGYFFRYYNTLSGAEAANAFDEILFPDQFTSPSTTVYVRVTLGSYDAQCFVIVPLRVIADEAPVFDDIVFLKCLENTTGIETFHLLDKKEEILNGRNAADHDIYFYVKRDDADAGNIQNAIPADYIYTNVTVGQVIWVRVVNKNTGCFYVGPMQLMAEEKVFAFDISTADKSRIEKCATPAGPGGTAQFDLTLFVEEIVIGQNIPVADLGVIFFYNNAPIDLAELDRFSLPIGTHEIVAVVRRVRADGTMFLCQDETRFTLTVFETPIAPVLQTSTLVCIDYNTNKLLDPYTIDSGFKAGDYEFQWERRNGTGPFTPIAGATKSYYVVESIAEGNVFRVVVKFKGQECSNTSNNFTVNFVEDIKIKIMNADSKGILSTIDGEERISIVVENPTDARLFEYALDEGAYQDSKIFYDVLNGTHRVWVRYKDQRSICPQYVDIFVLGYPRFFTPNGDGFNDTWNIPTLKGHPEAVIYIYDRYGKLLTQFTPATSEGWDGTFNGKPMPSTDYWFTVEYLEEAKQANLVPRKVQYKGHFSLKR
ncbi:T9SS type B sorting domain-containing protein [Myroides odoratus]